MTNIIKISRLKNSLRIILMPGSSKKVILEKVITFKIKLGTKKNIDVLKNLKKITT